MLSLNNVCHMFLSQAFYMFIFFTYFLTPPMSIIFQIQLTSTPKKFIKILQVVLHPLYTLFLLNAPPFFHLKFPFIFYSHFVLFLFSINNLKQELKILQLKINIVYTNCIHYILQCILTYAIQFLLIAYLLNNESILPVPLSTPPTPSASIAATPTVAALNKLGFFPVMFLPIAPQASPWNFLVDSHTLD